MQKVSIPIINEVFEEITIFSKNSTLAISSNEQNNDIDLDSCYSRIYYLMGPHYSVKEISLTGQAMFIFKDQSNITAEYLILQGSFVISATSTNNFRILMNKFSQFIFLYTHKIITQESIKGINKDNFSIPSFNYAPDYFKDLPENF